MAEGVAIGKRVIRFLIIGNSVGQDQVAFLPWLLRNTCGDGVEFKISIFFRGGQTVEDYIDKIEAEGDVRAGTFSTAVNTDVWTNERGSVTLTEALTTRGPWDYIAIEPTCVYGYEDNPAKVPTFIEWIRQRATYPFKLCYMMHHDSRSVSYWDRNIALFKRCWNENPFDILFPCGFAIEYAKSFMDRATEISRDGVHADDGLPRCMGSYVLMGMFARLCGFTAKIYDNPNRITESECVRMSIPDRRPMSSGEQWADLEVQTFTDEVWRKCQMCSLAAIKSGDALVTYTNGDKANVFPEYATEKIREVIAERVSELDPDNSSVYDLIKALKGE